MWICFLCIWAGDPQYYVLGVKFYLLWLFYSHCESLTLNRSFIVRVSLRCQLLVHKLFMHVLQWMHKPLLEGRLSMNCEHLGSCVKLCGTTKLPGHLCTSALLSKMVLLVLENDMVKGNEDAERKKIDNISKLQW